MNCYLGIDFGTSGARAIVLNQDCQLEAEISQRFGNIPSTEQAACWQQVLLDLIERIPLDKRARIQAIAINGTSSTVLLCDRNGQPLAPPLLYNDASGTAELPWLQQFFAERHPNVRGKDNVLNATSSLIKLLWWKRQPCFTQARYLMHQADWLAFLLHGQPGISDYHNSLKLGYDVEQLCYPAWFADLDVQSLLPRVVAPGTPIGCIQPSVAEQLGLPKGCQVCAGTTDSIAAFLASGANAPGEAVTSLGSTLVLKLLSHTPVEHGQYGIYSHRLGDLWLVGGASNTGGAVLQQFFSTAELASLSVEIDRDRPSPLDYYPLTRPGERFPINDPLLPPRLDPRPESKVEFLHGLLESMARIEARGYQLLQSLGATPLTKVYTAGGGASNPAWTAIRQRHLQVPVLPSAHVEAAYGTALLAMIAFSNSSSPTSSGGKSITCTTTSRFKGPYR
jgi:sugar (pentulose or hexulose) kinase